jgi:hypothetical protein
LAVVVKTMRACGQGSAIGSSTVKSAHKPIYSETAALGEFGAKRGFFGPKTGQKLLKREGAVYRSVNRCFC